MKKLLIFLTFSTLMAACGDQRDPAPETKVLKGYLERGIAPIIDTLLVHYEQKDLNVDLDLTQADTYEGFRQLLSGRAPMLIASRTYTPREDSLMQAHKVEPFKRIALAHDGLVLIAKKDFPLDTLNHSQIVSYLSDTDYYLKDDFQSLTKSPEIAVPETKSSVYAAVSRHLFNYKPITIEGRLNIVDTQQDVIEQVKNGRFDIGLVFLSTAAKDTVGLKYISIGYNSVDIVGEDQVKRANSELGKGQVRPKPVHASYIIMRQYPYVVTHWIYLQNDIKDNYFYFARYLGEDNFTQTYFTNLGIQGEHVKYKLRPQ